MGELIPFPLPDLEPETTEREPLWREAVGQELRDERQDTGRTLAHFHKLTFNALLWLIALHLVAVAFYCIYKREALISAMLTGYKSLASPPLGAGIWFVSWWRFVATVVAVVVVVFGIASGLGI